MFLSVDPHYIGDVHAHEDEDAHTCAWGQRNTHSFCWFHTILLTDNWWR